MLLVSGSQMGVILHLHLQGTFGNVSRRFWLSHLGGVCVCAVGIQWVEVRDAARHLTMYRTAITQNYVPPIIN